MTKFWKFGRNARLCHVFVSFTSDLCSEQIQLMTSAHLMPTALSRLLRILSRIFHRSIIHPEHIETGRLRNLAHGAYRPCSSTHYIPPKHYEQSLQNNLCFGCSSIFQETLAHSVSLNSAAMGILTDSNCRRSMPSSKPCALSVIYDAGSVNSAFLDRFICSSFAHNFLVESLYCSGGCAFVLSVVAKLAPRNRVSLASGASFCSKRRVNWKLSRSAVRVSLMSVSHQYQTHSVMAKAVA